MKDSWRDLEEIWNFDDYRERGIGKEFYHDSSWRGFFRGRWVWQGGVAFLLFILLIVVFQFEGPGPAQLQANIRYVLAAKESDMTPVLEAMARTGSWLDPFDNQVFQKEKDRPVAAKDYLLGIPASGKVARGFGTQRSPIDNSQVVHNGIDILVEPGVVVRATLPGKVIRVEPDPYLGRIIELEHENGLTSLYGNPREVLVETGQEVEQGEIIGKGVGNAKTHLNTIHFEVREKGEPIDPIPRMATVETRI